jgi:hypothetical protein
MNAFESCVASYRAARSMKMLLKANAIVAVFSIVGCAAKPQNQPYAITNPMPEIWAGLERKIQGLKEAQSTYSQWKMAATESAEPVTSLEQLRLAFAATGKPADEGTAKRDEELLVSHFLSAPRTVHFGFECDFHAIVFFDKLGRQIYAYP